MFIVYQKQQNVYARNFNTIQTFAVDGSTVVDYYQSTTFGAYDSNEEATARFNDVIEAAADGKPIYDFREKVGYWKPKKAGRKPATEKAPTQHHEPAPKK